MSELAEHYGLWGLFLSAFVSSTLAPGGSEAVLAYLAHERMFPSGSLLAVATLGNTLGAVTTWLLGLLVAAGDPLSRCGGPKRRSAIASVRRWGVPLLLFSWLPVIGDGFCFAAGWLKLPFRWSVLAIVTGKALRYGVLLWVVR